jgi:hypothetical protein
MSKTKLLTPIRLLWLLLALVALAACSGSEPADDHSGMAMPEMDASMGDVSADMGLTQASAENHFVATLVSDLDPPTINELHGWTLHVETPDGAVVENASVSIDGGMPEHNHGFATEPEVTGYEGDGNYRIEGVKFQMSGRWEMRFTIDDGSNSDEVVFNVMLP